MSGQPPPAELGQKKKLATAASQQQQQQPQDCMGCRILGALFGVTGAAFVSSALLHTPAPVGAHRMGIIAAAGTMFSFGMYRAFF